MQPHFCNGLFRVYTPISARKPHSKHINKSPTEALTFILHFFKYICYRNYELLVTKLNLTIRSKEAIAHAHHTRNGHYIQR